MDAFTKRISSKIAPVLGSEPSAMFKQSSSSIMRRSMTMREIELRRHLSSNVADDDNPDADLVRTEAESTRHAHPGAARGDAWTANLERAAEHLVDSIHLPTPRAVSMEERTAMAACFVRHAITRTPLTEGINWQSPVARAVHRWRQHTAYEWTRRLALLALLLLVLWEPPVTGGGATASAGWAACSVIEIVCSVAFLGDLVLMLLCTSPRHFFRSPSSCAFGLIVITISLDALVCAFYVGVQQPLLTQFTPVETRPYPLRVSRVARPFLLPFVWKTVGHMTLAIIRSLPSLADLSILILATLVFSTLLGLAFFGIDPEALLAADHAASGAASGFTANPANSTRGIFLLDAEWAPPWAAAALSSVNATPSDEGHRLVLMQLQRPLATMPTMVVQLAVAFFTADNYPQILYESFRCDGVGCNAFVGTSFFVILIIVGHVILMTVFIAVVYDVYKRQHAYLILYERVAERQALLAAFTILDIDGDRRLSRAEFSRLLGAVRPNVDAETVELTFRLIDADRSDTVDRYEFVEAAVALMVRVPRARVGEWAPWATWRSVHVGALVEHRAFSAMCDVAIVMYIILLLLTASGAKWSKGTFAVLDGLDVAFIVYFTLEVLLKLVGLSFETFWQDDWNRVDAFVVPLSVATLVLESALQANSTAASAQASAGSSVRALRLLRLLRLGRLFRVFGKVVNSTIKTKVLLATVSRFGRVMSPMLGVLLMLMYAFSIVGMELMHGSLDPNDSASISGCAPLCPSFATVATSWRTLFQVLLGANWTSLLVEATARDKGSVLPAIFFLCFVTICHVLMLSSLVVALMLEVYDRETEKAARAASADDKMSILCDTIAPPAPNDPTLSVQTVLFSAVRDKFAKCDRAPLPPSLSFKPVHRLPAKMPMPLHRCRTDLRLGTTQTTRANSASRSCSSCWPTWATPPS